jgi:hypothetical protein
LIVRAEPKGVVDEFAIRQFRAIRYAVPFAEAPIVLADEGAAYRGLFTVDDVPVLALAIGVAWAVCANVGGSAQRLVELSDARGTGDLADGTGRC